VSLIYNSDTHTITELRAATWLSRALPIPTHQYAEKPSNLGVGEQCLNVQLFEPEPESSKPSKKRQRYFSGSFTEIQPSTSETLNPRYIAIHAHNGIDIIQQRQRTRLAGTLSTEHIRAKSHPLIIISSSAFHNTSIHGQSKIIVHAGYACSSKYCGSEDSADC
jgi:hypothetical protein